MTAASALANHPVISSPSIAGVNPDAALLALGSRFNGSLAAWRAAYSDWKRRQAEFDAFVAARAPKALRFDPKLPFALRAHWEDGALFTDAEIERIRAGAWGDLQRRADRIVAAADRWRPRRDARAAALRVDEFDQSGPGLALENRVRDLQDEIAAMPDGVTFEGVAVKARSILAQQEYFGLDQSEELADIMAQLLRAAGAHLQIKMLC